MHVVDALLLAGMEYGVIKIANRLPDSIEPSICCLRFQAQVTKQVVDSRVRVIALNERTERNYGLILTLARVFRRERVDVVHSHNWQTYLYAVLGARLAGVPVVIHGEHGHDEQASSRRRLEIKRRLTPLVTRFLAVSENLARELREDWRIAPERILPISNGVDLSLFGPELDGSRIRHGLGLGPKHEIIINVGGIRRVKDHSTLIRAFAHVHAARPASRLLIVGSDYHRGLREELDALASSLGILDAILFTGVRRDIAEILAASDVYVNSSTYEGMSNTILEAMAMKKPVIATSVGGNVELVREGETGYLTAAGDPEAMAARIELLLADPARGRRIGEAGRSYVEAHHQMGRMVQSYSDLYEETYDRWWLRRRAPSRERAKRLFAHTLVSFGLPALRHRLCPRSLAVLTYHRVLPLHEARAYPFQAMVVPRDEFEGQMAHLARHYHVLPLPAAIEALRSGTLPPKAVTITFDDGYRDNYEHAWSILSRFGLPATFFVVTDALDRRTRLWWDELAEAVGRLARSGSSFDALPGWVMEAMGPGWRDRPAAAVVRLVTVMNHSPREARMVALSTLRALSGTSAEDKDGLMMTWTDAREMFRDGITFGSHTRTHAFLDELSEEEALREVGESTERLREILGAPVRWLAYPRRSTTRNVAAIFSRAGIEAAVCPETGINRSGSNLYALRRIDAGYLRLHNGFDPAVIDTELSGLLHTFRGAEWRERRGRSEAGVP